MSIGKTCEIRIQRYKMIFRILSFRFNVLAGGDMRCMSTSAIPKILIVHEKYGTSTFGLYLIYVVLLRFKVLLRPSFKFGFLDTWMRAFGFLFFHLLFRQKGKDDDE